MFWIGGSVLLILILTVVAAAFLLDEPLRRKMEADINSRLKGYTVRIGRLDFHPLGLSLDLEESTIYQSAHPDPPIAHYTQTKRWYSLESSVARPARGGF